MSPRRPHRLPAVVAAACAVSVTAVLAGAAAAGAVPLASLPTDPLYEQQTALAPGAAIGAPEAWQVARGSGVLVAVLDTGVDAGHPDLQGALWTNPGEVPGNGRDDDRDGYVDDVHGVDLVNGDGDPDDDEGHGTHVAGIVAARANGTGVVGLAPGATVLPVKVLNGQRRGTADGLAEGIRFALAHRAQVISVSVNGAGASAGLRAALAEATVDGVSVVASAGNDGSDLAAVPSYPAASPERSVLAVGATDGDSVLASFSNFGAAVSLTAPGVAIASTGRGSVYEQRSGTSMAAPEVAAALALLHGARPDLSDADLRAALLEAARRPASLVGRVGVGGLDVAAALHRVLPASAWPAEPRPVRLTAKVRRRTRSRARSLITWQVAGGTARIRGYRLSRSDGRRLNARDTPAARGAWVTQRRGRVTVTALDADGQVVARGRVTLR